MATRRAACSCGNVQVICDGDPVRISMCHCLECQRQTGAVFGNQAWFSREQIISILATPLNSPVSLTPAVQWHSSFVPCVDRVPSTVR